MARGPRCKVLTVRRATGGSRVNISYIASATPVLVDCARRSYHKSVNARRQVTYVNKHLLSAKLLAGGVKSFLPVRKKYTGTGGSDSARYCYGAWLRHAISIAEAVPGLRPRMIAELGPGDSLGLGIAALLSGVDRYVALDVLAHTNVDANVKIVAELTEMFRARADIPGEDEFPELYPRLADRAFPAHVLAALGLVPDLSDDRVTSIRRAILESNGGALADAVLRYLCPWPTASLEPESIDLIVTQAVLQDMDHWTGADALSTAFEAMSRWLKPGGAMSHQVNLAFPDTEHWNQHWSFGELTWKIIRGRRPYYVNRVPASEYLRLCERYGFEVTAVTPVTAESGVPRAKLSRRFRDLPASDYATRAVYFVAVKR